MIKKWQPPISTSISPISTFFSGLSPLSSKMFGTPLKELNFWKVLPTSLIRGGGGGGPNMLHLNKPSRKGNSERHYWNWIIWPSAHLLFQKNVNFEITEERNKTILSLLNPFFSSSRERTHFQELLYLFQASWRILFQKRFEGKYNYDFSLCYNSSS